MRGFLAEYAQGDVYMEGIKRKKEWRSGELADFFQQMAVMTGDPVMQGAGDPWGLYGQQKVPENI